MALLHVAVTGRDRRHLCELRNKFRVVVVGAQETRRGIVVDAYIPAERVNWLRKKGYGVTLLEEVEIPGHARQAEGRAAAETRLKRRASTLFSSLTPYRNESGLRHDAIAAYPGWACVARGLVTPP